MPLDMRPRRPVFANGAAGSPIASAGGIARAPAGGAPGAVSSAGQAAPQPLQPAGQPGAGSTGAAASSPLGQQLGIGSLPRRSALPTNRPGGNVLPGSPMAGSSPLGGQRETTAGNVGLAGQIAGANAMQRTGYEGAAGASARNTTDDGSPPLSRATGGGGTARTTSPVGMRDDSAATIRGLNGLPPGSSLPPLGGKPSLPGAIAGPGAQPATPTAAPPALFTQRTVGNDAEGRAATGLFNEGGTFAGIKAGQTQEGYNVWMSPDGKSWWAETPQGWTQVGDPASEQARTQSWSVGPGGVSQPPPSAPASSPYGSTSSGLQAGGQSGPAQGGQPHPAGGQAGATQTGYSQQAGSHAQSLGLDPFVVQALLDMGIPLSSITGEGVTGIEDPDFGFSGDAEWNDIEDDEAGALYRAGQNARENKAKFGASQAQGQLDSRIEQLLSRIGQMSPPTISGQVIEGRVAADNARFREEQSRALGAQLSGLAGAGFSPEAQQAAGYQTSKDIGLAAADREASTRMGAEQANLQGRMMQYANQMSTLQKMLTLPMLTAQQAAGIQNAIAMMEAQMASEKEMATWQTNQVTGWDYLRDLGSAGLQGGINAGANWLGGKLGA